MHKQGTRSPEHNALRKDGGTFIKALRNHAGLTQRDVSIALNFKYYTMISQIEAGSARCPPDCYEVLAETLGVDKALFAQKLMQFYDRHTYKAVWGTEKIDMLDLFKK